LFSHFGVASFKVHEYSTDYINGLVSQISPIKLEKFTQVFVGHYHGYQTHNNITYVSAPLQSKHGDEHSKHGFVFYNTNSDTHEFIENLNTPYFISIKLNKSIVAKILALKNYYIRIIVEIQVSKELLITLKNKVINQNYELKYLFNITDEHKLAVIDGWRDFVMQEPDEFISLSEKAYRFIVQYHKPIVTGGIILLVVVLVIILFQKWEKRKEVDAEQKFAVAVQLYQGIISPNREGSP
jgi:hypothetical protein